VTPIKKAVPPKRSILNLDGAKVRLISVSIASSHSGGMDFVWLRPAVSKAPVIELINGGVRSSRPLHIRMPWRASSSRGFIMFAFKLPTFEQVMAELRRRGAKILIDIIAGAPGSGVAKGAFIADPWENIFELLELARESESLVTRQ
jgi:hypothetical protein